jgi:solute carrier family 13 (sodium-dependent dicarboxylate transporter), member 2/3/5
MCLGPVCAALAYFLLPPHLSHEARMAGAIGALMATWWLTEALPVSATALVPLVALPLTGISTMREASAPYADPIIFLFLGGFLLGEAMQKWGLHKRVGLLTVLLFGTRPRALIAGMMAATAFISLWVSNTAAAVMMTPIALSLVSLRDSHAHVSRDDVFSRAMLLGITYAASLGGLGTIIGTPPNGVFKAQVMAAFGHEMSFVAWMRVGMPVLVVLLPLTWVYIVFLAAPVRGGEIPGGRALVKKEHAQLGRMGRGEWVVLVAFVTACLLWVFQSFVRALTGLSERHLGDTTIAMGVGLLLFLIPINIRERRFALDWESAERLPWGVLVLFGGGLSIATAVTSTGLEKYLASQFAMLDGVHPLLIVAVIVFVVLVLSELASNTAVATAVLPVLASASVAMGVHPFLLMLPATLAASCGFMLPAATPPNAIVFATKRLPLRTMIRAGCGMDMLCAVVIVLLLYFFGGLMVGEDLSKPPEWAVREKP